MMPLDSPVVRLGVQAASPFALVVGTYLLFAGHNQPGGGFAAGLVFGAVVTLRTLSGLQRPSHAVELISAGVVVVCVVALVPMVWGDLPLDQQVVSATVPVIGKVKTGTALPFDIGVTAIVVGLVIALLDGLSTVRVDRGPEPSSGGTAP
jgi:multicomponent Na+:H+ antiporter subunit A